MHYLGMRHKYERQTSGKKERRSRYVTFLDWLTLVVGIVGPLTVVPQIYSIFTTQSADGVSLTTWLLMALAMVPWVLYGMAHRDATLIVSFVLWTVVNLLVVVGVIIY